MFKFYKHGIPPAPPLGIVARMFTIGIGSMPRRLFNARHACNDSEGGCGGDAMFIKFKTWSTHHEFLSAKSNSFLISNTHGGRPQECWIANPKSKSYWLFCQTRFGEAKCGDDIFPSRRMFAVGFRQRPYFVEYTRSHPNSEVKRRKARSVLGWGTAREALRVLLAFWYFWMRVIIGSNHIDTSPVYHYNKIF